MITILNTLFILYISFFSAYANTDNEQFVKDKIVSIRDKKLNFYVSANSGKIYYNNPKTFTNGIKAIGEKFISLINKANLSCKERLVLVFIKKGLEDEIHDIEKFNDKIDFEWLRSASVGYYAGKEGQINFEAIYSKATIKDNNFSPVSDKSASIFALLLNFYYNHNIQNTQFTPYIGLGIGPATFKVKKINRSNQNLIPLNIPWFAYQIKVGVDYSIIPEIKTFLGYRYFNVPTPILGRISTHNIEVGLMFNF